MQEGRDGVLIEGGDFFRAEGTLWKGGRGFLRNPQRAWNSQVGLQGKYEGLFERLVGDF